MKISWKQWATYLLKGNLVAWIINGTVFAVLVLSGSDSSTVIYSGFFPKITLLETGIAFLIGGALAFSGSILPSKAKENILKTGDEWSMEKLKKSEKRANKFIALAITFFLESLIIALVLA